MSGCKKSDGHYARHYKGGFFEFPVLTNVVMFYYITGGWVEFISTFATPLQGQGVRNFFLNVCLFISNVENCTLQLTTTPPQGWVLFACSFPALTIVLTTTPRQGCVELFLKVCLFICSVDRASAGNEPRNVQILDAALPTMNSVFASEYARFLHLEFTLC